MNPKIVKEAATYIHQAFDDGYAAAIEDCIKIAQDEYDFDPHGNTRIACTIADRIEALLPKGTK